MLGQLAESKAGFDRHDVPAFANAANSRAAIVFEQGESWGDLAGHYLSDYHHNDDNKKDSWSFTVYSRLAPQVVSLRWDGLFKLERYEENGITRYHSQPTTKSPILEQLSLIDLKTGTVTKAVSRGKGKGKDSEQRIPKLNTYEFDMHGENQRDFRWVLGKVKKQHFEYTPDETTNTQAGNKESTRVQSSLEVRQLNAAIGVSRQSKFGTPPQ